MSLSGDWLPESGSASKPMDICDIIYNGSSKADLSVLLPPIGSTPCIELS
jgi:hypothetical protein